MQIKDVRKGGVVVEDKGDKREGKEREFEGVVEGY